MKPQSIKLFDYFYLGAMFLGGLGFITGLRTLEAEIAVQSGMAISSGFLIGGYVIGLLIGLLLWYLVSHRRSGIAKWLIVLLFLLSLTGIGSFFAGSMPLSEIYSLLALIAQAVAVGLLFRGDAIRWLAGSPDDTPRA